MLEAEVEALVVEVGVEVEMEPEPEPGPGKMLALLEVQVLGSKPALVLVLVEARMVGVQEPVSPRAEMSVQFAMLTQQAGRSAKVLHNGSVSTECPRFRSMS